MPSKESILSCAMLTLPLALVLPPDPAAPCVWKEPKEPAKIEATDSTSVEFRISSDPNWFRCAKRAGGKLELIWSVGSGGELTALPPKALTSYGEREPVPDLCTTPGPKQVQATIKGSGEMQKLDWSSTVVEVFCPKCNWSGDDNMLALHTAGFLTPKGSWTIDATFEPGWYGCAKTGSALELRLFTGATSAEVKKATTPTYVVKGLE